MMPGSLAGAAMGMGRMPGQPVTGCVLLVSNLDEEVRAPAVRLGCRPGHLCGWFGVWLACG